MQCRIPDIFLRKNTLHRSRKAKSASGPMCGTNLATSVENVLPQSGKSTFHFGIWFANADTLYNRQTNVADAQFHPTAGVQKWVLENHVWIQAYVLQNVLNIGVLYSAPNYPASLNPATGAAAM